MTKLELIKMQMQLKAEEITKRKDEIERYAEYALEETKRGHYSTAAQYAEKLIEAGYRLDAMMKENKDFNEMLKQLEQE